MGGWGVIAHEETNRQPDRDRQRQVETDRQAVSERLVSSIVAVFRHTRVLNMSVRLSKRYT